MTLGAESLQIIAQLRQRRIVAGAEAGKCHLLIARVVAGIYAVFKAEILTTVTDGAIDIARLTEAAATDAATEQLQRHAILHDLRRGHDGLDGEIGLVHILHDTLLHLNGRTLKRNDLLDGSVIVVLDVIEAGDVETLDFRGGNEELVLAPTLAARLAVEFNKLHRHIFTLAQGDNVDEVRHGLSVIHGCTACDHQGGQALTLGSAERDVGKIQHVENGGERHLIAHGKGHNIKIGDWVTRLEAEERDIVLPHLLFHVAPRSKHALAPNAVHLIHDTVENTHAQIGHADLISVGETEGHTGIHLRLVLHHRVILAARIAGRLLHAG